MAETFITNMLRKANPKEESTKAAKPADETARTANRTTRSFIFEKSLEAPDQVSMSTDDLPPVRVPFYRRRLVLVLRLSTVCAEVVFDQK